MAQNLTCMITFVSAFVLHASQSICSNAHNGSQCSSSVLTLPVKSFSCVLMNGCNADCDAAKTQLESGTELQNNSLGLGEMSSRNLHLCWIPTWVGLRIGNLTVYHVSRFSPSKECEDPSSVTLQSRV